MIDGRTGTAQVGPKQDTALFGATPAAGVARCALAPLPGLAPATPVDLVPGNQG